MKKLTLVALALIGSTFFSAAEEAPAIQSIFNGQDLAEWEGDTRFWSVRDGAITGETTAKNPTEGNTFLIWKGGNVGDFEVHAKFKIRNHNSGIQYRSAILEPGKFVVGGCQADIDDAGVWLGSLYEERGRGALAKAGQKVEISAGGEIRITGETATKEELSKLLKKDDWNEYVIVAQGNHLLQKINGIVTVDVTDRDPKAAASGVIALQLHAGPPMLVQFKDIELMKLE